MANYQVLTIRPVVYVNILQIFVNLFIPIRILEIDLPCILFMS